jgi:hypothetical protein
MEHGASRRAILTVKIAILVEGAAEAAFAPALRNFVRQHICGDMPKLDFSPQDGRIPKAAKLKRIVDLLLGSCDAVIALTDIYTGTNPPHFSDAADAKKKMKEWVDPEDRFYPHVALHDFEAWLLPYWERIRRLSGSNRQPPSQHPESVNHDRPPSKHLQEVFMAGKRRSYSKVRDGSAILRDQDLSVAAAQCPELKAFLNTILRLAGGTEI